MLNQRQKDKIIELYEEGLSNKRISEIMMLPISQVSNYLRRNFGPKHQREEFSHEEIDTLIELYNKELFYNDIAKQMVRRYGAVVYNVYKLQREGKLAKRGTSFRMKKLYYK